MKPDWVRSAAALHERLKGAGHGDRTAVIEEVALRARLSPAALRAYHAAWIFLETLRAEDPEGAAGLAGRPHSIVSILERWNRHDPATVRALVRGRLGDLDVPELKRREQEARTRSRLGTGSAPRLPLPDLLDLAGRVRDLVSLSDGPSDWSFEAGGWRPPSALWRRRKVGAVLGGGDFASAVAFELTSRSKATLSQRAPTAVLTAYGLIRVVDRVLIVVDGPAEAKAVSAHGLGREYQHPAVQIAWRDRELEARLATVRLR